jgi:hypothetical protein
MIFLQGLLDTTNVHVYSSGTLQIDRKDKVTLSIYIYIQMYMYIHVHIIYQASTLTFLLTCPFGQCN